MIKRILILCILVAVSIYLIVAVTIFNRKPENQVCKGMELVVKDSVDYGFITEAEVTKLLKQKNLYPEKKRIGTINVRQLEEVLSQHPFISRAECYLTSGGKVGIEIYQRIPLLRVMSSNGDNYYIDHSGKIMNATGKPIHVAVATGFIDRKFAQQELYELGLYLQRNPFWKAQVEQINVTPKKELEIVPRVGDHILFLGKATDFEEKFSKLQDMAVTDFIAAIELGSTHITGIAGKKNADGSIQILAYAYTPSSDCIKKGAIFNLDKTTQVLVSVIQKLEEDLQASIKKVYVGIGGQSIRSTRNNVTKQLGEDTKISQALIESLMESNREISLIDQEILDVEPQEYKVGNNLLTEPVGISADRIEGRYLNIIAHHTLKDRITKCFNQTKYEIADYFLSPVVTASVVLTDSEKRSGCALVDLGADTTTVAVYKNNILRHLAVIPLGSNNITKDICSLQIEEEDAEQLKLRYGCALTPPAENDETADEQEYSIEGKCSIAAHKLEYIVEARVNEIISNVWNQIMVSEYGDKLLAGLILTGGASNMPNMDEAFKQITKIEKIRIAKGGNITLNGAIEIPKDGTQNTLIGLLAEGKENCLKVDPRRGHQLDFIEDLKEKEEEAKRKEAERIQAEEARRKAEEEAERIRKINEEKKRQEEERNRKRLEEYTAYVEEASLLLSKKKYKAALKEVENARRMHLAEKEEELDELEKKINKEKKENSWFDLFAKKVTNLSDEILKDN